MVIWLDLGLHQWNRFIYLMVPKLEPFSFFTSCTIAAVNIHASGMSLGTGVQKGEVENPALRYEKLRSILVEPRNAYLSLCCCNIILTLMCILYVIFFYSMNAFSKI